MLIIQKITQRYHSEQDRISFSVQSVEQQVVLLWLTQRLANRLVSILVSWLGEDSGVLMNQSFTDSQSLDQQGVLEQTQQAQLTTFSAVDVTLAQGERLLNSIDLARDQNGAYILTFNWIENNACLILNVTELRQWLSILYRLFGTAEWPKQAWSAWFSTNNATPSTSSRLLH